MRRSRSQLGNLTQGHSPAPQPGIAGGQHADDIQRRINDLAMSAQQAQPAFPMHGGHGYPGPNPLQNNQAYPNAGHPTYPYPNVATAPAYPPHYTDMPAPGPVSGGYHELEQLRASMDQMAASLQDMRTRSTGGNSDPAFGSPSVPDLSSQVAQLRDVIAMLAKEQPNRDDWASLRTMLEQANEMIAAAIRTNGSAQDTQAYAKVVETSHTNLSRQLVDLKQSLSATSDSTQACAKVVETSHAGLSGQLADLQQSLSRTSGLPDAYAQTLEASHDGLRQQLAQLQQSTFAQNERTIESVKSIADRQTAILEEIGQLKGTLETAGPGNYTASFDSTEVETRLEEITRAIVAISHSGVGPEQLERIEARISDLSKSVARQTDSRTEPVQAFGDNDILAKLNSRLEAFDAAAQTLNSDLSAQLENVQEKLENLTIMAASQTISPDDAGIHPLIARLDALMEQSQSAGAPSQNEDALAAISEQISDLAAQLQHAGQPPKALAGKDIADVLGEIDQKLHRVGAAITGASQSSVNDELLQRLARMEEQVTSSRDITLEFASQVADDAVQKALQSIPEAGSEQLDVKALADEIRRLQEASEQNGSNTLQTFDAVRDSLEKLVDRLQRIETSAHSLPGETSGSVPGTNKASPSHMPSHMPAQSQTADGTPVVTKDHVDAPSPHAYEPEAATSTRQTGNDMVSEYRAVTARAGSQATRQTTGEAIGVETLVAEAARAEEERARKKAASQPDTQTRFAKEENEREFKSDPGAAMFVDDDIDALSNINPGPPLNPDTIAEIPDTPVALTDKVPLEPQGLGPDLAALVRKANEQRKSVARTGGESTNNEFIAAARRAAQAAAEEASAAENKLREQSKKKGEGFIPGFFKKRNKTMIMVAGTALLAALAIPLGSTLISQNGKQEIAQLDSRVTRTVAGNTPPVREDARLLPLEEAKLEHASKSTATDNPKPVVEVAVGEIDAENRQHDSARNAILSNEVSGSASSFGYEISINNPALQEAVADGDPAAMYEVARRYMEGQSVKQDIIQAAIWLERAAERGYAPAQYLIGNLNEKGEGVVRNRSVAANWYTKAANQGHVIAMHNLAVLKATPDGETEQPNMSEAYKWFRKAAEFGVRDSQVNLGIFYTKGVGTPVSLPEAYRWFTIAARAGDKDARAKRDVIASALRPDQLADAKELISTWQPAKLIQSANDNMPAQSWTTDLERVSISNNRQAVVKAQSLLAKLGYNTGPVDGIIGRKTRRAISRFQQKSGIDINGEVTFELLRALQAISI